ncbi:MAG TPA: DUF4783 domain-containing protein [Daejeonella sp.]|nr:DUF4783 domain-containing protein [Daejeonella sp.]
MRTKLLLAVPFFLLFVGFQVPTVHQDIVNNITGYLKTANTREISKNLASTVELTILSEENVYSKVQAELILKDFFAKHQPVSTKIIRRLDSNPNYHFAVVQLNTTTGTFRVNFSLKDTGGRFLITDMRIDFNKE